MTSAMSTVSNLLKDDPTDPADSLQAESAWRTLPVARSSADDIEISRWKDYSCELDRGMATTPDNRFFIALALKSTRIKLARDARIIFDGSMPAGTLFISGPSQELSAVFQAPFDFVHFHVPDRYFSTPSHNSTPERLQRLHDLVLLRNPLAEQLARTLMERGSSDDRIFIHSVAQTLAMYLHQMELPAGRPNALPKWRLKRVEEYIKLHLDQPICLADLARVAGLSRMHFAAQFRAATGYRPREYLLQQRIEQAKLLLSRTGTPLAEIALAVGFCTQAHFSTVFKRIAQSTPARWRCSARDTGRASPFAMIHSNRWDMSLPAVRRISERSPAVASAHGR